MKKRFFPITILLIFILTIIIPIFFQNYKKHHQEDTKIIIASDIHYLSPQYRGEYFKEPSDIFDGKVIHYSSDFFDAFLAEVMEKQPKALVLSGDITLNGSVKSHEEVLSKLSKVEEAGIDVLVIPGNHDVDSGAGDYSCPEPMYVASYTSDDFMANYFEFGPDKALSRDETTFSYIYEVTPYLRILMLDTNCYGKGFVQDETLAWIETELKAAKWAGADVIAVSHQNLHIHNELLYFSYQFYNASELFALYEKYDVKVNFSGHLHTQSIVTDSSVPEIVLTAMGLVSAPYGEITYNGNALDYKTLATDVAGYAASMGSTDENLLNYEAYSRYYFEEVSRLQIQNRYADALKEDTSSGENASSDGETAPQLTQEEIDLLAETFAKVNTAYFMGESFDAAPLTEGIALWEEKGKDFTWKYIKGILEQNSWDKQSLHLNLR